MLGIWPFQLPSLTVSDTRRQIWPEGRETLNAGDLVMVLILDSQTGSLVLAGFEGLLIIWRDPFPGA